MTTIREALRILKHSKEIEQKLRDVQKYFICPNCKVTLIYDPDTDILKCPVCGKEV